MSILFINNKDSFVWNLVDFVSIFNSDTIMVPNTVTCEEVDKINPDAIIISPGPGTPEKSQDIGNCIEIIRMFGKTVPILGVCLGLQAIAVAFGGRIGHSKDGPVHGKTSLITYKDCAIFNGISNPLRVGRYHSLAIKNNPECLNVIAQTENGIIMGVKHEKYPIYGLQFHPESIITDEGLDIIENFLKCI
ncbi:MAG: aminodeoxychorismate/anthranilate synthase component II [Methanosarcinaceae archaeon]|nr:aminodeoxychorismate/anthranilate synthase component II [Methanosarcinaceae archaeon]NKQ38140.1 aminodeoxychorismate/anthranilate synthase component II [Methanosarcinales archaeon]